MEVTGMKRNGGGKAAGMQAGADSYLCKANEGAEQMDRHLQGESGRRSSFPLESYGCCSGALSYVSASLTP